MENILYSVNLAIHVLAAIFCVAGPFYQLRLVKLRGKLGYPLIYPFDRVMENIRSPKQIDESEQFFESLFVFFRPIAITAAVLIIIIAGYNITTTGYFSIEGALGIPEVTVDDVYDPTLALVTEE